MNHIAIQWSANFAYGIGLLATDGNLSKNGRSVTFVSKDLEQMENFEKAFSVKTHIGKKSRGAGGEKKYFVIQLSDARFHTFLNKIGITPSKSKTISKIDIPKEYMMDFIRGCFDGDGYTHSYWDKRWKSSFMFYLGFCSASIEHVFWLQDTLNKILGVKGHISSSKKRRCHQLRYAKREATIIVAHMYENSDSLSLSRKRLKIQQSLGMMCEQEKDIIFS